MLKMKKIKSLVRSNPVLNYFLYKPYFYFYSIRPLYTKDMGKLSKMGIKYGTDKANKWHTFRNLTYLDVYQKYFRPLRHKKINILEIGVRGGNSLRLWKNYFKNAHVYGLDINPVCIKNDEKQIKVFIGSQNDSTVLKKMIDQVGNFDIIIDDGSHINELTIFSFEFLFPFLKRGGIYVIEDLGNSYQDLNKVVDLWDDELHANKRIGIDLNNKREDIETFFLKILHDIDLKNTEYTSIHFWSQLAIILK